jgi:hypothetical protein
MSTILKVANLGNVESLRSEGGGDFPKRELSFKVVDYLDIASFQGTKKPSHINCWYFPEAERLHTLQEI